MNFVNYCADYRSPVPWLVYPYPLHRTEFYYYYSCYYFILVAASSYSSTISNLVQVDKFEGGDVDEFIEHFEICALANGRDEEK